MNILKKNTIIPFAMTWVDLEGFMLSEIRLTKKGKYYMIPLICESKNTIQMNLRNRTRLTDMENKLLIYENRGPTIQHREL